MNWGYRGTYPTYFTQSLAHYQSTGGPSHILEVNPLPPLSPLRGDISTQNLQLSPLRGDIFTHKYYITNSQILFKASTCSYMAPVPCTCTGI